jgi:hypothetical protein
VTGATVLEGPALRDGALFPPGSPAVQPLVAAVFAHDLPGCAVHLPTEPLEPAAWTSVFESVHAQRGDALLAWAIHDGHWPATPAQRQAALTANQRNMALAVLLERELADLADDADRAGIDLRVLKGPASAHLDELDPARRSFGDLDLLVRADDLDAMARVLEARGGRRRYAEPHRGFDRRFSKGMSFTFERNCEVDLHRSLASGAFGLSIVLDDLFTEPEPFVVGGRRVLALGRTNRFLHAAYHALLGADRVRLNALRDVVHTAPRDDHEVRRALARARRWHGEAVVARATRLACTWFGWTPTTVLDAWAGGYVTTARDRRWMAAYVGGGRSYAGQMLVGLEAIPGVRDRVAYVTANARSPRPAPVAERWKRGIRALHHAVAP